MSVSRLCHAILSSLVSALLLAAHPATATEHSAGGSPALASSATPSPDLPAPAPHPARARTDDAPARAQAPTPPSEQAWSSDDSSRSVDTRWSLGSVLGFSTNGLNVGLGLRGGKTLANRVYVGGTFVYNTGGSTAYYPYAGYSYNGVSYATAVATASSSLFYTGPEGGYDFDLKYVVLRAYLGIGLVHTSVSYSTNAAVPTTVPGATVAGSTSATGLALWPGASVLFDIPHSIFFVGGDLRLLIPTGSAVAQGITTDPAVGLFGFGGAKFGS